MIDMNLLFKDENVKDIPIIDVLKVVSAIQKQEYSTRLILDNNILKEEKVNHG